MTLGGVAGALALFAGWRASLGRDRGANHSAYFQQLSAALDRAGLARPTLVIDRQRLLDNVAVLNGHLQGAYDYRVVAKSLPSVPLLDLVVEDMRSAGGGFSSRSGFPYL